MTSMRRSGLLIVPLLVVLGACGDQAEDEPAGAPESQAAAELPSDLCAAVPPEVVDRWALEETSHDTTNGSDTSSGTCEMSGTYEDAPVSLRIDFTTYGGGADAARQSVADELETACTELGASTPDRFTQDDNDCTAQPRRSNRPLPTTVVNVARSVPARGIVRVEMSHDGLGYQLVAPEVIGISTAYSTVDVADLG